MKKTFKLWADIIGSPSKGTAALTETSPVALPLVIILVLSIAASAMLIPILSSDAYTDALTRVQISTMKERGTEMSQEQIAAMEQQLQSTSVKRITIISSTAGAAIAYIVMLLVSVLLLKLIIAIFKEKASFKLLFRIMVFLAIISMVQMIVKNGITIVSDYSRVLSRVTNTGELQHALTSPVSLGILFSPSKINASVYYLIDAFTDIFNWIYYLYLYAAMRNAVGIDKKKAVAVTIVSAVVMIGIGFIITLIV